MRMIVTIYLCLRLIQFSLLYPIIIKCIVINEDKTLCFDVEYDWNGNLFVGIK